MVLVNGGPIAKNEVLRAVRRGWPVVVIESSGELADEIAGYLRQKPTFIMDPVLAEILADGNLHLLDKDEPVEALAQLLTRQLSEAATLELAWQRFAHYDANAARHQKEFDRLQVWILRLGVYTTGLVLTQTTFQRPDVANFCARALVQASLQPIETANFLAQDLDLALFDTGSWCNRRSFLDGPGTACDHHRAADHYICAAGRGHSF